MLIIGADTVRELLSMADCIDAMEQAMRAVSNGAVRMPDRVVMPLAEGESHFFVMPGTIGKPPVYGAKLIGLHPSNPAAGRPAAQGFVALFDGGTGSLLALVDGGEITRLRTAAASALATRLLARPDAHSHGIFGAGTLADSHLESIACVRSIEVVRVWGRDAGKAAAFVARQRKAAVMAIEAVHDPADAAACDIVSTVTNAHEPILRGAWLRPGAHVNLVGAHDPEHREADSDAVAGAAVYVDCRRAALREAGDLLIPMAEGRFGEAHIEGQVGELLESRAAGRTDPRRITIYKSLGLAAQDLFAAERVYRGAVETGAGQRIEL
jgi:ornithine cyclodeaminase/alanine dehydrogenase-like protein (mu-crystallin family)